MKHSFGLDRPLPIQYGLMMKKLFITRDLTSFVNRGNPVIPQIEAAAPVTLSLVFGAAIIWVVLAIAMGWPPRSSAARSSIPYSWSSG